MFEKICHLPEYYLTGAEYSILEQQAATIASMFPDKITLVELGSGSAVKTHVIIKALIERHRSLRFIPIDISRSTLEESASALVENFQDLEILAVAGEYQDGLDYLKQNREDQRLILWLGSNVGNFERKDAATFFSKIHDAMAPNDRFLAGIDLRKDRKVLEHAYDDAQGVTARFNKNILARINRDLGGHFDLTRFQHRAIYNEDVGRVEMHLQSLCTQSIAIDRLNLEIRFNDGETIHTEHSYKYSSEEIETLATAAHLSVEHQWFDSENLFSVSIFYRQ